MNIFWLENLQREWRDRVAQSRAPHAVLLLGPAGAGKRAAAVWLAQERLGLAGATDGPQYPVAVPEHADLRWLRPAEDKKTISIDQVRDLVASLALTTYAGAGKVAVIEPANAMTDSAANGLLKTLEEPSGNALIILVADRLGRLPATIVSRCQRISVPLPAPEEGLDWLRTLSAEDNWPEALRLAGNAPLAAIEHLADVGQADAMSRDFADIAERRASPVDVAAAWSKYDPDLVLDWLCRRVQDCILDVCGLGSAARSAKLTESVRRRIDRRNLFCYLDIINRLRGQAAGSFNVQLTLESLLIDWSRGLKSVNHPFGPGELLPGSGQG